MLTDDRFANRQVVDVVCLVIIGSNRSCHADHISI
jgi:hypothetical protein